MAVERHVAVLGRRNAGDGAVAPESSGEAVLAAAVLKLAFEDLQKHRGATDTRRRRAFREAYVWVASNERQWPFSFLNVCDMLDLSPGTLRSRSSSPTADGERRCLRGGGGCFRRPPDRPSSPRASR